MTMWSRETVCCERSAEIITFCKKDYLQKILNMLSFDSCRDPSLSCRIQDMFDRARHLCRSPACLGAAKNNL